MNQFDRGMIILSGGIRTLENDPGFSFRVFQLRIGHSARFFRISNKINITATTKPPITGLFVEATLDERLNQICLAFCTFPQGSDGGTYEIHGKLAYDSREVSKGCRHIVNFLMTGKVPVADNEYAEEQDE